MSRFCSSWCCAVGALGLLLAGCSHPAPANRSPAKATSESNHLGLDVSARAVAQAHAHYAAGVVHDLEGDAEAAVSEYELAAKAQPTNDWLVLEVSRRLLQTKQFDRALALLTLATSQPKASGALYARLGLVYSQLGKADLATNADLIAISRSPLELSGYQNLFLQYVQNRQEPEALKILDQAAAQAKASAEFLIGLSELYGNLALQMPSQKAALGAKAAAALERAAQQRPGNPGIRLKLADALSSFGERDKAAGLYLLLLKDFDDQPLIRERIRAKLADIYLHGSDHKKAAEQLEALLRDDPTNPVANYYLGSIAYDDKRPADAVEFLRKAILLSPGFEQAYYDLALAQIGANKAGEALTTLEQARKKFPQNFVMEFWTGLAYSHQKSYKQALEHLIAAEVIAKATDPRRLTQVFYFQLGSASERLGDIPQAERYFQKSLELDPKFAEAMNYLGYMWAERGEKLEQARELLEKAVKAEPNNAAFLDSLGWVQFKQNQAREALASVQRAVELSSQPDPTLFDHLGDIFLALHEPGRAREAFTKSLSLEDNPVVRKKLEALAQP